jgi:hypothetical protein
LERLYEITPKVLAFLDLGMWDDVGARVARYPFEGVLFGENENPGRDKTLYGGSTTMY